MRLVALLTPAEVAARLQLGLATVYALAADGELDAVRIRRSIRFEEDAVEAYIAKCRTKRRSEPSGA